MTADVDTIHCEHCGRPWPTDKPGLDEHEAACLDVCRTCLNAPGRCSCPRPGVRMPVRTTAPWCSDCGMTIPAHWAGCPEVAS